MLASLTLSCLLSSLPSPGQDSALTSDGSRLMLEAGHAFVELESSSQAFIAGEPFELIIRVGIERSFAHTSQIQLFRNELDVPVQIQAPWVSGLGKLVPLDAPVEASSAWPRCALGDELVRLRPVQERNVDGQFYDVYELKRRFRVAEPQEFVLASVEMRYAFATEFEDNFLSGRSPVNRTDALVRSRALQLSIMPLALGDPPFGFSGAIGNFTLSASLEHNSAAPAGRILWTLRLAGEGNLADLEAPSIVAFEDFNLLGVHSSMERASPGERSFVYDLSAKAEMPQELPAFNFLYYDVIERKFRELHTEPLSIPALKVGKAEVGAVAAEESLPEPEAPRLVLLLAAGVGLLGLGWFLRRVFLRTPHGEHVGLALGRSAGRGSALKEFHVKLSLEGVDVLEAYSTFLAACLGLSPDEVQAAGLAERLLGEGVSNALALRAEATLGSLLAARYGKGECDAAGQAAPQVVEELAALWG